jgi:hypothetical protein
MNEEQPVVIVVDDELHRAGCSFAGPKWVEPAARSGRGRYSFSGHLHYRARRRPNVGPGDEGRSRRVSHEAVP